MDASGFKVYRNAIGQNLIRECKAILLSILSNPKYIDMGLTFHELYKNKPDRFPNIGLDEIDAKDLFIVNNPSKDYIEFRNLLVSNVLWYFAANCFAHPQNDIAFSFMNITRKPAKFGPSINWHRDFGNKMTSTKSSKNMLRIIIPLDSCGAENGAIAVVPGSHKIKDCMVLDGYKKDIDYCNRKNEVVSLSAGNMLAISSKLIHGSGVNRSNIDRDNIVIQFVLKGSEHICEYQDEPFHNYSLHEIRNF